VLALHPLLQGGRQGRRPRLHRPGQLQTLACYPGKKLENNYSLNTVDICPVGALTSTDFRFKMRVWFLKQTNSIDTESERRGEHGRLVARGRHLPDHAAPERRGERHLDGRQRPELYKASPRPGRLESIRVNGGRGATLDAAARAAADFSPRARRRRRLGPQLGRGAVPDEEARRGAPPGPAWLVSGWGGRRDPRLRRPQSERPRRAGHRAHPGAAGRPLGRARRADRLRGRSRRRLGRRGPRRGRAQRGAAREGRRRLPRHPPNATSAAAKVVIPTLTVFEKSGTFVNQQFRIQKFAKAVPGPPGRRTTSLVLRSSSAAAGGPQPGRRTSARALGRRSPPRCPRSRP
jgi:NADH-quinone oxidoreductase subunit G